MSSKEFQRRKLLYSQFDECASLFLENLNSDYVYRVTLCVDKSVSVSYVLKPCFYFFNDTQINTCDYLSFDRFTRSEFYVQLRYFLAFVDRLSSYQLSVLKSSRCCNNLFNYTLKYKDAYSE